MVADVNESVRVGHERLRDAATQGALVKLCHRHDLDLLVVFGSVLDPGADPRDLDVAVRFGPGDHAHATLKLIDDLYRLTGSERIDLMVLNRAGPLARERALTTGEPLFQRQPGVFANAQIAAIMQRLDTDRFRAMDLELMSS
jgi:predicted nucleotidyltransferase